VSGLEKKRLEALERSVGGAGPKCLGVLVSVVNGKLRSSPRRGEPMGAAERAAFGAGGSRCPACGAGFLENTGAVGDPARPLGLGLRGGPQGSSMCP
jgi:hypothetical protein